MQVSGQPHGTAALPRRKNPRYPVDRLGGPQSRSERRGEEKILDPSVIQPIASRYIDWDIPAP
jgi:hypothetical protein